MSLRMAQIYPTFVPKCLGRKFCIAGHNKTLTKSTGNEWIFEKGSLKNKRRKKESEKVVERKFLKRKDGKKKANKFMF